MCQADCISQEDIGGTWDRPPVLPVCLYVLQDLCILWAKTQSIKHEDDMSPVFVYRGTM